MTEDEVLAGVLRKFIKAVEEPGFDATYVDVQVGTRDGYLVLDGNLDITLEEAKLIDRLWSEARSA